MTIDHFAAAEQLLKQSRLEQDAVWSQVLATRALAHATLAARLPYTYVPEHWRRYTVEGKVPFGGDA